MAVLKDFQRTTVEHVHSRFFDPTDPSFRFLVADEVGLGKTMVARGVTARLIDHLWDTVDRIDVVYICSNAAIAAQNIKRLRVSEDIEFTPPTRLTLLPKTISGLRENKLNFVALTPSTSFSQHSATGMGSERALLYVMLREAWEFGDRMQPFNVLCHWMDRDRFRELTGWIQKNWDIDQELQAKFLAEVKRTDLREVYEQAAFYFQRRQFGTVPDKGRQLQRELIDRLRRVLSRSCIDALEPDLIILDEFQRFKHLLDSDADGRPVSDAGELAHQLFDYRDPETGDRARTLMLSATPYTAYGFDPDDPGTSHQKAFTETVGFLLNDPGESERLNNLLTDQLRVLLSTFSDSDVLEASHAKEIRDILLRVMCRTERLGATEDRDGMLHQVDHLDQKLDPNDILAYASFQQIARHLHAPDVMEYWKSSPYLLNLMEGYQLNRDLERSREKGLPADLDNRLTDGEPGMLERAAIDRFERIDPGNPRVRELCSEILDSGAWQLLWLNPSLPYYKPSRPFAHPGADRFTKRLIFSNWAVVPKAVSTVLSYAVEQKLTTESTRNLSPYADQSRTPGAIKTLFDGERVQPGFGLVFPSRELARLIDPLALAEAGDTRPCAEQVVGEAAALLRPKLEGLHRQFGNATRSDDHTWYWAAPFLADAAADPGGVRRLLADPTFRTLHGLRDDSRSEADTQWERCLDAAAGLLTGETELGQPPGDLPEVTARIALGGLSVTALRCLMRVTSPDPDHPLKQLTAATEIGLALRGLFNLPHATHLMHTLRAHGRGHGDTLWREILEYSIAGNLQAVLDEYVHLLPEHLGHVGEAEETGLVDAISEEMTAAIGLKTTRTSIDFYNTDPDDDDSSRRNVRARFAVPFGSAHGQEKEADANRIERVRAAFNSPFWPFVLTSTSVGQEGLDFHLYCHAVVHWNLPYNPVDLEQREGRVHRYKNHAVRRNLARAFGSELPVSGDSPGPAPDPWKTLFKLGTENRPKGQTELWPYWIFQTNGSNGSGSQPGDSSDNGADGPFKIERHVMAMPLSRDQTRIEQLLQSLVLYRSVMGQPRQEDLVAFLKQQLSKDDLEDFIERTRIDLTPPASDHVTIGLAGDASGNGC